MIVVLEEVSVEDEEDSEVEESVLDVVVDWASIRGVVKRARRRKNFILDSFLGFKCRLAFLIYLR